MLINATVLGIQGGGGNYIKPGCQDYFSSFFNKNESYLTHEFGLMHKDSRSQTDLNINFLFP